MKQFELVQVHETNGFAEVMIRDKNSFYAFGGNLKLIESPKSVYPPDYEFDKEKKVDELYEEIKKSDEFTRNAVLFFLKQNPDFKPQWK